MYTWRVLRKAFLTVESLLIFLVSCFLLCFEVGGGEIDYCLITRFILVLNVPNISLSLNLLYNFSIWCYFLILLSEKNYYTYK